MKAKRVGALFLSAVLTMSMAVPVYAGEAGTVSMEAVQEEAQEELPESGEEMGGEVGTETETVETEGAEGDEALSETSEDTQTSEQDKEEGQEDTKTSETEGNSASEATEDVDAVSNVDEPQSETNDLESEETETLAEEGIQIPDDTLNSAVHRALGLEEGEPVTEEEMLGLTELSANFVLNLEGLQYAKNLSKLTISRYMIFDSKLENLEVITELTQLKELEISVYHINDDDLQIIAKINQLEKLTLSTNDITDISVLADMKNLNYLDLSDNDITDVSALAGMSNLKYINLSENNLSDVSAIWDVLTAAEEVNLGKNRELELNPDFQEAYFDIAFDSIEVCQMVSTVNSYDLKQKLDWKMGGHDIDENTALLVQISIDDESIAEAELESSYYWAVPVTVTTKAPGKTNINFTIGDVTKTLTIIVGQPEPEVPQENVTDKLPQFQGCSTDAVLYEGSIWNFNGEKTEKISGDKKITNYVSRKVYFVSDSVNYDLDELDTEYAYDLVGLDENNTLYYWPALGTHSSGLGVGDASVVAENVEYFDYNGYIDENNVYHMWQYLHEEPVSVPEDICTQENAERIERGYLILQDGTTMLPADKGVHFIVDFAFKEYTSNTGSADNDNATYYLNYDNQIIKRLRDSNGEYTKEIWVEDVSDIGRGCYIKDRTLYSISDQNSEKPIDTDVDFICDANISSDSQYSVYYQKGNSIYELGWEYGQDKADGNITLYSEGAVGIFRELLLKENDEVWVDGEGGYLYLTSVKALYQTSGGDGAVKYMAARSDGSMWVLDPPLTPYVSFEPQDIPDAEIWQGKDESTGISATGQGIAESVRLYASTVNDDTEEYKTEYESIAQSMEELGAATFSVYDIKLLDEQENAVQPEEGNPVTVTVPLPEGYSDNVKVYHMDSEGNLEELGCTVQENTVNFQTSGFSLFVIADFETEDQPEIELPFTDVQADDWYYEGVSYVYQHKLMTGMTDTLFAPEDTLVRAQFATVLYRMNGEPEVSYENVFPDVPEGQWFTEAVMWASNEGIVNGYGDTGLFGSDDNITREQMALMMHRYAEYKGSDTGTSGDLSEYKDASEVSEYAKEAMQWAVGNGIIVGEENGTALNPQGNATRAECAMIIERFVEKYGM